MVGSLARTTLPMPSLFTSASTSKVVEISIATFMLLETSKPKLPVPLRTKWPGMSSCAVGPLLSHILFTVVAWNSFCSEKPMASGVTVSAGPSLISGSRSDCAKA